MSEKYFLVVHCPEENKNYAYTLDRLPDNQLSPIGIPQEDEVCYKHNTGTDPVAKRRIYKAHRSFSLLISVQNSGEDKARLKEIACEKADIIFKKKGVERG